MKPSPLNRNTPLRRKYFNRDARPKPRQRKRGANDIPLAVRREVEYRSKGCCEIPSCPHAGEQLHHRLMRSQGGPHTVENLLNVCTSHHVWIHSHPQESYESGFLLRSGSRPSATSP